MQFSRQRILSNLQKLGLDETQTKLAMSYCRDLGKDNFSVLYDRPTVDLFVKYAKPHFPAKDNLRYYKKIGYQQSVKLYSKIESQVNRFCEENHPKFRCPELDQVIAEKTAEFKSLKIQPLAYYNDASLMDELSTTNTHAGWEYVLKGVDDHHRKKADFADGIYERFISEVDRGIKDGTFGYYTMIGTRTQNHRILEDDGSLLESTEGKTRTILMISLIMILLENKFNKPLCEAMHAKAAFDWWASGKSDREVRRLITSYKRRYRFWMSIDYSSYDATISDWLLRMSYDMMEKSFESSSGYDPSEWSLMVHDSISKKILMADGSVKYSNKGNTSGLKFTALNASNCNDIATRTTLKLLKIQDFKILIVGDDLLVFWNPSQGDRRNPEEIVNQFSASIKRNFGLEVHPHKCNWIGRYQSKYSRSLGPEQPTFLASEWFDNGKYRNPIILLGKAAYPERKRNHNLVSPEVVFFSYVLSYPLGMRDGFDVDAFLRDYPSIRSSWKRAVEEDIQFGRMYKSDMFGMPDVSFDELYAA